MVAPLKYRVLHTAASLGIKLVNEHPEIADYYRRGLSRKDITDLIGIDEKYEVAFRIAMGAVGLALSGYIGGVGVEKYDGLIKDKNELAQLSKKHMEDSGDTALLNMKGIHNLTEEQTAKREIARFKALGYVPWSNEERNYIRQLLSEKDAHHTRGRAKGKPKIEFIRISVRTRFHRERSPKAIKDEIWRIRHKVK